MMMSSFIIFFILLLPAGTLFSFARPMYAFSEGAGTGFVTIIRTGNSTISQNIMLSGPLQQGNITREVTFAPGVTAVNVSFNIIDDNVALEPVEMLMFELSTIPGQIGTALGTPDGTIVNIEDDDSKYRQTDTHTDRQTNTQTDTQTDRLTHRQPD